MTHRRDLGPGAPSRHLAPALVALLVWPQATWATRRPPDAPSGGTPVWFAPTTTQPATATPRGCRAISDPDLVVLGEVLEITAGPQAVPGPPLLRRARRTLRIRILQTLSRSPAVSAQAPPGPTLTVQETGGSDALDALEVLHRRFPGPAVMVLRRDASDWDLVGMTLAADLGPHLQVQVDALRAARREPPLTVMRLAAMSFGEHLLRELEEPIRTRQGVWFEAREPAPEYASPGRAARPAGPSAGPGDRVTIRAWVRPHVFPSSCRFWASPSIGGVACLPSPRPTARFFDLRLPEEGADDWRSAFLGARSGDRLRIYAEPRFARRADPDLGPLGPSGLAWIDCEVHDVVEDEGGTSSRPVRSR